MASEAKVEYDFKQLFPDVEYPLTPPFPEYPVQEELNDEQKKAIEDLRARFPEPHETGAFVRVLIARSWDAEGAYNQLKECLEWRKEYGTDNILLKLPPKSDLVKKLVPHAFHKEDRTGRPIYIEKTGFIDIPRLMNLVPKAELMHNHVWGQEFQRMRCREASKKHNKLIYQSCNISDLTNLSLSAQKGMDFLKFMTDLDKQMYPENMGVLYIVNAPWYFGVLWKIVRGWLDARTREKIHVLGSDFKEQLQKVIDPENLPVEYGGTCTCGGERGCVPIDDLSDIPVSLFDPELTEVTVAAGQSLKLEFDAKGHKSTVSWFYRTVKHDIKFSVAFIPAGTSEKKMIQEPTKLDSAVARVEGFADVEGEGKIIVEFDNTYSYWTAKTVRYNVGVDSEDTKA